MTKPRAINWSQVGPGTVSVWAGEDTLDARDGTQTPIVTSVTFGFEDLEQWTEVARGNKAGHLYSRSSNPTVQVLEEKVRCLEGAAATIADSYGGTSKIFLEILPHWDVDVEICETALAAV